MADGENNQQQNQNNQQNKGNQQLPGGNANIFTSFNKTYNDFINDVNKRPKGNQGKGGQNQVAPNNPNVDSFVLKINRKFSAPVVLGCVVLQLMTNYLGIHAIQCLQNSDAISDDFVQEYCYLTGKLFSVPSLLKAKLGKEITYPGIGTPLINGDKIYHKYYIWFPFFFIFHAALLYAPYWTWKMFEGGKIMQITNNLRDLAIEGPKNAKVEMSIRDISRYLRQSEGKHKLWASIFIICEVATLGNIILLIWLTDLFVGNQFEKYGVSIFTTDIDYLLNSMREIFPRVVKCTGHGYGLSGTIQDVDSLCVLGVNIVTERVFLFLWFWYRILFLLTFLGVLYRVIRIVIVPLRIWSFKMSTRLSGDLSFLDWNESPDRLTPAKLAEELVETRNFGDWILLEFITKNIPDSRVLLEILMQVRYDEKKVKNNTPSRGADKEAPIGNQVNTKTSSNEKGRETKQENLKQKVKTENDPLKSANKGEISAEIKEQEKGATQQKLRESQKENQKDTRGGNDSANTSDETGMQQVKDQKAEGLATPLLVASSANNLQITKLVDI